MNPVNKITSFSIIIAGIFFGALAMAQTASEITFPVPELNNCADKESCFAYCELPENGKKCLEFAKKHGLLPEDEIRVAEQVLGVKGGPGGCNSKNSCEEYCNNIDRIEECIAFAEENGLMKGKELEEAKKVRAAVQRGAKMPGGCKNKNSCQNYCENPDNIEECLAFAEEAGFLPPEELEQAKKFMPLMKSGQTPGGCRSKDSCEAYCESDEHFEECINFAEKNGMIPEEERKHIEAFKKAGGKGPGGCKGRQCQAFCENPGNQQTCFEWAKDNGILKDEDVRRMEQGRQHIEKVFTDAPPEVQECINSAVPGGIEAMRSGKFFGGEAVGEKIRACFEGFMSQMGGSFGGPEGEHRGPEEGQFSGPGGCKGPEECMSYCKDHLEECQKFSPTGRGPGEGPQGNHEMPGGEQGKFRRPSEDTEGFSGQGGFPGDFPASGERCDFEELNPVCAAVSPGKHHTFNNECFAKSYGATNLQPGVCPGDVPCPTVRNAVCGIKGGVTQSYFNKCAAEGDDASILYVGECKPERQTPPEGTSQDFQQQYNQEFQKQYEDQYRQQYEQQYQQQYQQEFQNQYDQQYQQQYQYQQPPPPPSTSSVISPLGLLLAPFVELVR